MTAGSHDAATCPAFGGCSDCRSAKFEAASPDVELKPVPFGPPWAEPVDYSSAGWSADPVDYSDVPAFNSAADATLARAGAIHKQRGDAYGDSWALKNIVTTFLDCALTAIYGDSDILLDAKRLLESAAIADVKESRLKNGSWKLDNSDDGINYRAAYATWHTEYTEAHGI